MKLFRMAAVGAGLWWFLDERKGPARRERALGAARGLVERVRALIEGRGLGLAPRADRDAGDAVEPAYTARRRGRRPEVREVKSPAELEPGVYSARPDPTFSNRVDRPDHPAARPHGPLTDELEPTAEDWRHGDVTPRVELVAPPEGSHITEAHLGVYVPRDDLEASGRRPRASDEEVAPKKADRREPDRG